MAQKLSSHQTAFAVWWLLSLCMILQAVKKSKWMINDMCCHTLAQLSPDGRGVNTSTVGAVIMHQSPKLQVCPSGCHLTINYKTFLLLTVFSRCPTAITQGPSKWPGPLYRSKIKVDQSTPCGYSKHVSQDAWKDAKD